MIRLIAAIVLAATSFALAQTPASQPADASSLVGKPAPEIKLPGLDGKTHNLAESKGNVIILDFWATWCVACHQEMPHLQDIYQKQSANGLVVWAIDTNDDTTKATKYVGDNKITLPVLFDNPDFKAATDYLVDTQPETVIIGRDGIVKNVFVGYEGDAEIKMEQAITAALKK
jgi:peroxiredoxin